jgi:A/G-specific adenine glycosylase
MATPFSLSLLAWFARNARRLPWRGITDPYAVWVSEVMLQQTRVEAVIPYYERWMRRYPTIQALAAADQQEVLSTWEGLGYYSRARNLHQAARIVVSEYSGVLPAQVEKLRQLPGVGRYSAGAIASIAFGSDEPALDGNIRRVLARCFNVTEPAGSSHGERVLWALAASHLPAGRAGEYNQALMDLGATLCTPRQPACSHCPLAGMCQARRLCVQEQRPVRVKKAPTPHYTVTAAVIHDNGTILIGKRPPGGLLGAMWEFPGGKQQAGEDLAACLQREVYEELGVQVAVGKHLGVYRHAYTHFRVTLHAFECQLVSNMALKLSEHEAVRWVSPQELSQYPMGRIDRKIAKLLMDG